MGTCCGGSTPQPPNPIQTGAAQTATNVDTAVANAFLNNVNQTTPQGNLNYNVTGNYPFTDPTSGITYQIPRFTAEQTLSPAQAQLQQTNVATQQNLGNLALSQSGRLGGLLGQPFDLSGAPPAPNAIDKLGGITPSTLTNFGADGAQALDLNQFGQFANQQGAFTDAASQQFDLRDFGSQQLGPQQAGFADAGQQQADFAGTAGPTYGFDPTGNVTGTYDNSQGDAQRARVEQSLFARMQPQNQLALSQLQSQLADQGIRYGSPAYTAAMDNYNRGINDQMLGITAQGGQEQKLQADLAAQQAGFQNAAQQQAYQQAQGRGAFFNTAEQQAFGEAQARGQFGNAAQQAAYAQAQGRGQFANAAQAQTEQEALNRGQFYNTAQQNLYQQMLGRGTFDNAARAQNLQQMLAAGGFANQAQQTGFGEAATGAQFTNAALQQMFQQQQAQVAAQNAQRAQYLQEQYALRNQPINETTALLSGSQVQQPNFITTPQQQVPTTDIAGLINQNFQQQQSNAQIRNQATSSTLGGLFGLGGNLALASALGGGGGLSFLSDRRAKKDVHRIGTVFAADPQPVQEPERKKLPIYEYSYKGDPASTRHIGPMAQDVEKIDPQAVGQTLGGLKTINPRRVMGSILRAA